MKKLSHYLVLLILLFANINLFAQMDTIYNKYGSVKSVGTIKRVGVWYSNFQGGIPYEKTTYLKHNKAVLESYSRGYHYDTTFQNDEEIIVKIFASNNSQYLAIIAEMKQFYTSYLCHGKYLSYYQNGNIKTIEHYRKGVIVKKKMTGYETGELKSVSSYKSYREENIRGSYLQGKYYSYYENGQTMWKGRYKKDGKVGTWIEYYEDGKLKSIGGFNEDIKPIVIRCENVRDLKREYPELLSFDFYMPYVLNFKSGKWEYYDDMGKLIKEEFYEKGKENKKEN